MDEQEAERSNLRISQENKRSDRIIQMDYCVSRSACFILHYGNQFSWVNENRARAHAANSNSRFTPASRSWLISSKHTGCEERRKQVL